MVYYIFKLKRVKEKNNCVLLFNSSLFIDMQRSFFDKVLAAIIWKPNIGLILEVAEIRKW